MKKLLLTTVLGLGILVSAQNDAYNGADDLRLNNGVNFQDGGTGIQVSLDYGIASSFSVGVQAGYLLGVKKIATLGKPDAGDRFDVKIRANTHLGDVFEFPENIDVYPGLNLGLKNFGGHVGARYFFNKGFGMFSEIQFPIARYNTDAINYEYLNNQFAFVLGVSFDLRAK